MRLSFESVVAGVVMGCVGCKDPPASADAAAAPSVTSAKTSAPAPTPTREAVVPPPPLASDAGIASCTFLAHATQLSRRGPYAIVAGSAATMDVVAQDHGEALVVGTLTLASNAITVPPSPSDTKRQSPACAAAGDYVFCVNAAGDIHRFRFPAAKPEADSFIAHARPGTGIAAALVAGHALVGYTRDHATSEGPVSEAYVESDDGAEVRVSEDGVGATSIALAPHEQNGAIAAYVDARRGMSPVHARTLTMAGKLALGKDAVVFVGGSAEPYTRLVLGANGATAWVLLPVAHDLAFGVAVAKIDGEAPTDAPVTWSDYPNGLDPAPIAATVESAVPAKHATYVARVRPSAPQYGSPRVLEIGELDTANAFRAFGVVPTQGTPVDVTIASDGASGFVLAYTDGAGGWVLRLKCGP